jgi:hypothetical protein
MVLQEKMESLAHPVLLVQVAYRDCKDLQEHLDVMVPKVQQEHLDVMVPKVQRAHPALVVAVR